MQPGANRPGGQNAGEQVQQTAVSPAKPSREEFTNSLRQWYQARNLQPDPNILRIGTRQIVPYDLFSEVMQLGGFLMVSRTMQLFQPFD